MVAVTTAADVVPACYKGASTWGFPASMLADNGCILTAQFRKGRCVLENEFATLGITINTASPTLPRPRPRARSIPSSANHEERPHSARNMVPPRQACDALDKAVPDPDKFPMTPQIRVRHGKVDKTGVSTRRHGTRLHHVGIGRAHRAPGQRLGL